MLKATGIVRKVDDLGRVVLPIELRHTLDIADRDSLEIYVNDEGQIVLQKYVRGCLFCGNVGEEMVVFRGREVCTECAAALGSGAASPAQS